MQGRYQQCAGPHCEKQSGFIVMWVSVFAALMALVMMSGLRNSWFQERVQNNAAFQQATFQAAESGLDWWLDHVQRLLLNGGIQALQSDGWFQRSVVACATRNGLMPGACHDAGFYAGDLPVRAELETRFLGTRDVLSSSASSLRYYHFQTQVTGFLEQQGERRFVTRHRQTWRWLDQELKPHAAGQ